VSAKESTDFKVDKDLFICPISQFNIIVPVTLASGCTYDLMSLVDYAVEKAEKNGFGYKFSKGSSILLNCPLTRKTVEFNSDCLVPTALVWSLIQGYITREPKYLSDATSITSVDWVGWLLKGRLITDTQFKYYVIARCRVVK